MTEKRYLIFTDLDGTLLDHETYSFSEAKGLLKKLSADAVPVIANTSKTRRELELLRVELENSDPFIVENGGAVYIPKSCVEGCPEGCVDEGMYWKKVLAEPREKWIKLLESFPCKKSDIFKAFHTMTVEELQNHTGLSEEKAYLANQREFGEPILWKGAAEDKEILERYISDFGGNVVMGGRFLHIGSRVNKGGAMLWLQEMYLRDLGVAYKTVALGDSNNDLEMLRVADISIIVRSPVHSPPLLTHTKGTVVVSKKNGPAGWAEEVEKVIYPQ